MKLGISVSVTKSKFGPVLYDDNFEMLAEQVAKLGYTGVELSLRDSSVINPAELKNVLQRNNLEVYAVATGQSYVSDGYCLYTSDTTKRNKAVDRIKYHLETAAVFGSPVIIGGIRGNETYESGEFEKVKELGDETVARLAEHASEMGLSLLVEPINRYESLFYNSLESASEFIRKYTLHNVLILADTYHMNIEEAVIEKSVIKYLPLIGYIHFADSNRLSPGSGHIDFPSLLQVLKDKHFNGTYGVEVLPLPDEFEAAKRSQEYLRSIF